MPFPIIRPFDSMRWQGAVHYMGGIASIAPEAVKRVGQKITKNDAYRSDRQHRSAADDHRRRREPDLREGPRASLGPPQRRHVRVHGAAEGEADRQIRLRYRSRRAGRDLLDHRRSRLQDRRGERERGAAHRSERQRPHDRHPQAARVCRRGRNPASRRGHQRHHGLPRGGGAQPLSCAARTR